MDRIVFSGTDQSARECAIGAISEVPVTRIGINGSDSSTIAYGAISTGPARHVNLFGISSLTELIQQQGLTEGSCLGVVILLDNTKPSPLRDLQFYLGTFQDLIRRSSVTIGVTKMAQAPRLTIEDYQREVAHSHPLLPVYEVDPLNYADVSTLMLTLLYCLDPGIAA